MKILWLSWKDRTHPTAGGAEVVTDNLLSRLAQDGHEVRLLTSAYAGSEPSSKLNGYQVVRRGGRFSVYWQAWRYYRKQLRDWPELVIDEMNTLPFFARFYSGKPTWLFVHQLCREIWFHQMFFPLSLLGYLLEPLYLRLLSGSPTLTVSESTRQDLTRYGFDPDQISVIGEGIELAPLPDLVSVNKFEQPTLLALGSIRSMKRTHHVIEAFENAKAKLPNLRLVVAGKPDGRYGQKVLKQIANSPYAKDIEFTGPLSEPEKLELLRKSHLLCVSSVKEGWGLVVTEAASQGTPAVVYDVDGLRDSTHLGTSGLITRDNTPVAMAEQVTELLGEAMSYQSLREQAWQTSASYTFNESYERLRARLDESLFQQENAH